MALAILYPRLCTFIVQHIYILKYIQSVDFIYYLFPPNLSSLSRSDLVF